MDTLINENKSDFVHLRIRKFYKKGNEEIEYEESKKGIDIPIKLGNDSFLGNEIFSFNEYDGVEITFKSENISDEIEIECYCSDEGKWNRDTEYIKVLSAGESTKISPGGDIEDMLVPGTYSIKIKRESCKYSGFYNINPANATWDELIRMRSYVEESIKGLSYNIYMERKSKVELQNNIKNSIIDKYRYLNEIKDILIINLNLIINNPITNIEKVYKKCNNSKKPNNKSQRWISKKGYSYNINTPNLFYEKRSMVSNDTVENRILKKILDEIYIIIIELSLECISIKKQLIKNINSINEKIHAIEKKNKTIYYQKNISKRFIKNSNNDLYALREQLNLYETRRQQIEEYITNLYSIKSNINYYLSESWIEEIDNSKYSTPSIKFIRNKHYNQIYRIYENLKSSSIDGNKAKSFPHKKSSTLFEIYNFLLVKDIMEDFGFTWISGWLKNQQDILSFNGDLNSSDFIILELGEYKAKIIYDKLLARSTELKKCPESQISAPPDIINTRPDILIEFYKDEEFLTGMIIEVKYRKLHYMYNYLENTDIGAQLRSYIKLDYHDGHLGRVDRKKIAISKVIALYPQQKGARKIIDNTYSDVLFLPIMPSSSIEKIADGYEGLKKEILEVLYEYEILENTEEIAYTN